MTALYRVFLGIVASRSRILALAAFGAVPVLNALIIRSNHTGPIEADLAITLVDVFGLALLVPVNALVFGGASLGDLVDDQTLVYLWLRPIPRWRIVIAALAATLTVAVPLAVIPITITALVIDGSGPLVLAAAASSALAALTYCGLFVGLGLRVRRSLAWGLAYVLIWESAVAPAASGAKRISVHHYARSLLVRLAEAPPRSAGGAATVTIAVVIPLLFAAAAVMATVRWVRRLQVA